ncbi:hypothetical protein PLICRDRAFT_698080, partial [Plicaturopsis crispa FD-325 SS-3]
MASRQGGKLKPLKAPKKEKKEEDEDEKAFKEKKKAEAEALKAAREKAAKGELFVNAIMHTRNLIRLLLKAEPLVAESRSLARSRDR